MSTKNKSAVYGYYGGVTDTNYYVPPSSPDFVPKPAPILLTDEQQALVNAMLNNANFIQNNIPNVLLRANTWSVTSDAPDNIDSFVMTTSGKPEDVIVYTSDTNIVNLNVIDGGYF